jgi:hypothetical protein
MTPLKVMGIQENKRRGGGLSGSSELRHVIRLYDSHDLGASSSVCAVFLCGMAKTTRRTYVSDNFRGDSIDLSISF